MGAASEAATVLTVPGVKTLRGPIPTAWRPSASVVPEMESASLSEALRTPGLVGLKLTKTWQVTGGAPGAAAVRAPVQVLLVTLNSPPVAATRLTFWLIAKVMGRLALGLPTVVRGNKMLLLSLRMMKLPESAT